MAAESNASSVQASGSAPTVTLPQDSGALQSLTKDDLKVLATNGSKLLGAQIGDLTGQGNVAAVATGDTVHNASGHQTIAEASSAALKVCVASGDTNCVIYYKVCSLPVQVQ